MTNKKTLHILTIIFCLFLLVVPTTTQTVNASEFPMEETVIVPSAAKYEWRYSIINGKLYKRLFNLTTQQWAGQWILA
ncbi:hypothetical protein [Fundicoccus culcitae]|uniref:Uncharacterized protein n=1 Tax=Fundicoccus culcitae TaxID=2969821 RepID=A0ABY5P7G8_9LACT|nr:hypothetical protein [Fundicoccus culcitae]UUX34484.1 hypothetical protein NRE15_02205 [Fundicoccus culcitae]